jgi:hypothetical protein
MKKLMLLCILGMAAAQAEGMSQNAPVAATAVQGTMLYSEDGHRLGAVYKVGEDGAAKVILDGKLVTIPASSLSEAGGKLTTTLTKSQVLDMAH